MDPKYFFATVKAINEQARTLDAIASTADIDRDSEVILPSAFEGSIDSFKSNPVILCEHQHRLSTGSSPVIGSAIPESIQISANEVRFTMRFAETPLGNEYWQLYKDKHMRAFSVGFIPLEAEYQQMKGKENPVFVHTKIELLEISAVPVPSNRRALARAKGFFDAEDNKAAIAEAVKEQIQNMQTTIEQSLDDIKSMIIANSGGLADGLLGGPSELPGPGGDAQKLSEQVDRIKESFGKVI